MSLRPAEPPTQEPAAGTPPCERCASLARRVDALAAALAEARAGERRALHQVDLLLRLVPEGPGHPLRYRLADDLNRALRSIPGVHGRLKRYAQAASDVSLRAARLLRRR